MLNGHLAMASVTRDALMRQPGAPCRWLAWSAAATCSLLVHGAAYLGALVAPSSRPVQAMPSTVELAVVTAPAPEPVLSEPVPTAARPPETTVSSAPSVPTEAESVEVETGPPQVEEERAPESPSKPVDLTGVTLTGVGDGGWASAVGDGRAMAGPLGPVAPRGARVRASAAKRRATDGAGSGGRSSGRPTVAVANLSRRPRAPNLDAVLARHYPKQARLAGVGGTAVVRARIGPDGQVCQVSVLSESRPGFGAACQSTLRGSRWSPPVDRQGRRVTTEISYTCSFRVQR